ncbi:hypothetical protein C0Q44_27060 [Paenibacillus sp. PCH8]|nr:hypothetical protein C0Q44_27060 [Paenibacillus sp. PCH8]
MKGLIPDAKADYYATYSTNHNRIGGIGLAYSNSPTGPWTKHGQVYLDTVVGNSTETPFVIWNDEEQLFFMYYQQNGLGINQSTALATSVDMINWTRVGLILDKPPGFPGDGHTGYFSCFRNGGKWIGFSVMGGGDFGRKCIWHSHDGRSWLADPRPLMGGMMRLYQRVKTFRDPMLVYLCTKGACGGWACYRLMLPVGLRL